MYVNRAMYVSVGTNKMYIIYTINSILESNFVKAIITTIIQSCTGTATCITMPMGNMDCQQTITYE